MILRAPLQLSLSLSLSLSVFDVVLCLHPSENTLRILILPLLAWIDCLIFGCRLTLRLAYDETLVLVSPFAHILIILQRVEGWFLFAEGDRKGDGG